jgi:hypothetical protein
MDEMTDEEFHSEFSNSVRVMGEASAEDLIGVCCQLADTMLCYTDKAFEGLPMVTRQMAVFGLISRMLTDLWAQEAAMQKKQ